MGMRFTIVASEKERREKKRTKEVRGESVRRPVVREKRG